MKDLKDKILNVSVWKKGKGEIIVASDKTRVFYESFRQIVAQSDGWEKLVASFAFPDNIGDDELKIYVYHTNNSPSYFDDFEINISDK